jgi:DNA polymerase-3 subunit alpha
LKRVDIGLEQIRILIRIGAFRFTGKSKQRLLWEAMLYLSSVKTKRRGDDLFETEPKEYPLPVLTRNEIEDAFDEIELLGFSLCDPFKLLAATDRRKCVARNLPQQIGKHVEITGYVVTTKETYTKTKQTMHFGTFLDEEGQVFDTVHFPQIAQKFPFRGRGFYEIHGRVIEEFGVPSIEVTHMNKVPMMNKRAEQFMLETLPSDSIRI